MQEATAHLDKDSKREARAQRDSSVDQSTFSVSKGSGITSQHPHKMVYKHLYFQEQGIQHLLLAYSQVCIFPPPTHTHTSTHMFRATMLLAGTLLIRFQSCWCLQNTLGWRAFCPNEIALWVPGPASSSLNKGGLMWGGFVRPGKTCCPLLALLPSHTQHPF